MTAKDKIARRKLSLLELAADLSNVSRACKVMGYSRQQFYEIRRNFQTYGAEGLIDRLPGARGPHPNRVSAEIEQAVLASNTPTIRRLIPSCRHQLPRIALFPLCVPQLHPTQGGVVPCPAEFQSQTDAIDYVVSIAERVTKELPFDHRHE
jgi:hypothetical protein